MAEKHTQNLCLEEKEIIVIKGIKALILQKNTTRHLNAKILNLINLIATIEIIIQFTEFHSFKIENITNLFELIFDLK